MDSRWTTGNSSTDGYFELDFNPEGVFLIVYPPEGKGKKVEFEEVKARLESRRVKNYISEAVKIAVLNSDKRKVRIAGFQEEMKINASMNVEISPDKLKAFMIIYPPDGGRMLNAGEIVTELRKRGVVYGIKADLIESLITYPIYNEMLCVAEGLAPVHGKNATIEFYFNTNKDNKPTILEDGRVDYRDLNNIENVKKGQKLCSLVPATIGAPGKTVTGLDMSQIKGKLVPLPKGKNTLVSEDGQYLESGTDGQAIYLDGKVNVFSTYEVPADVDNSTGNINFIGNVIVRGNVLSGFVIEAGGNVEVQGVVEGAVIKADGDIVLRRGIQGMGRGFLSSGGDIISRYIENSNVEARNNINAEAIMHSHIKCGNKLELGGRKGLLVGGTVKVGKEISAKVIGSPMATVTDIEVGVDPALRERYKTAKDDLAAMESDITKARQAITLLRKFELVGKLTEDKQEMLSKSIRTEAYLQAKIEERKEEIQDMEGKLQRDAYGKVRASMTIHNGVKIGIGTCAMYVKEDLQYCVVYRDGADVKIGTYDKR